MTVTIFVCGQPKDHVCDDVGPIIIGGENEDGTFWQEFEDIKNPLPHTWGSVSCSICGTTAIEKGYWV